MQHPFHFFAQGLNQPMIILLAITILSIIVAGVAAYMALDIGEKNRTLEKLFKATRLSLEGERAKHDLTRDWFRKRELDYAQELKNAQFAQKILREMHEISLKNWHETIEIAKGAHKTAYSLQEKLKEAEAAAYRPRASSGRFANKEVTKRPRRKK